MGLKFYIQETVKNDGSKRIIVHERDWSVMFESGEFPFLNGLIALLFMPLMIWIRAFRLDVIYFPVHDKKMNIKNFSTIGDAEMYIKMRVDAENKRIAKEKQDEWNDKVKKTTYRRI